MSSGKKLFQLSSVLGLLFHELLFFRDDIGILERVSGMAVTSIVHDRIKHHIENTCKGNFETSYLKNLEEVNNIWIFKNLYRIGLNIKHDLH